MLLTTYAPAQAADRYWDQNNTALGSGGTGIWNTTSTFWSPNGDGVSGPYSAWSNAALDNAFFSGTAGTVTLGGPMTAHNLSFGSNGYILSGSTLTLAGAAPTIQNNGGTTINSIIAGTSGLIKAGSGNLALTGVNTFSGGIALNQGTLSVNGDAALGVAGNDIVAANGTTLSSGGALSASRDVTITSGVLGLVGAGVGSARFTGAGGVNVNNGVSMSNDANDYLGRTAFTSGSESFTSIADLGVASSLGAPTTVVNGTISVSSGGGVPTFVNYLGDGDSSNRNWTIFAAGSPAPVVISNQGTGTLTLTGNFNLGGAGLGAAIFRANTADIALLGVLSGAPDPVVYQGTGAARTITLGGANTYTNTTSVSNVTVRASVLADSGVASSLGAAASAVGVSGNGVLSYTGTGGRSNRAWALNNGTISNDGSGALALSGNMTLANTATLGGSFTGGNNGFSGTISGTGNLAKNGASTWIVSGTNTYTGNTIVNGGTLVAGSAQAFGAMNAAVVNGGTLDLNGFGMSFPSLSGTGGSVDLDGATLTLDGTSAVNTSYAGSITGTGGLTKQGASTQTLSGANTYTGATTVNGGTLRLNFGAAGAPASDIIASASTLNMGGGTLNVTGANGVASTQTFNGLNVTGGNNTISAAPGTGGSTTINLGAINRTGGLINFGLPASGNITTSNLTLGGWATVNGTDYAKVVGGNITAFTLADYSQKDNAANWLNNEFITDTAGFFGTVGSTVQLGGLRYTRPVATTVTVAGGQTLGVDGTVIVAPTVGAFNQLITGGMMTGTSGGGVLGIQQNSTGNFTIASQIVDNGGSVGFTKAGTGLVTLANIGNNYTGATTVSQGTLSVNNVGNGGVASSIGASSAASSNLVLEGSTLRYTGASAGSDRGFTLAKSGAILGSGIEVSNGATNLSFSGPVTSSDGAGFTKSGAGTLTLLNAGNDYTGVTTINGGTLSVNTLADGGLASGIGASTSASSNLVLNGGELEYTGGTVSSNRGFILGANDGAIDVTNAATTLSLSGAAVRDPAAAAGSDTLTKQGAGTLVLSGTNTYTRGTTVNAGILRAGSTQAFGGTGTMTLANSAGVGLDLANFSNTIGALNGGGASGGNVTLGSATLRIAGGNGSYAGAISGTGGVWRTDGGTQTFNGCNNTYTGVTNLQGGTLSVNCLANGGAASGIGASSSASTNLVFTNGNLNYTGGTVSIDRGFSLSGWGVIDVANAATTLGFSGQVVGGGELYKDNAGTLVLSGNNTYTNNTRVRGGTLRAGSNTAFGTTNSFWMDNTAGALLDLNNFNASAGALVGGGTAGGNISLGTGTLTIRDGLNQNYAGAISGTGNLVKNGTGSMRLSGCNSTYSGSTTINGGFFAVQCLTNGGTNSSIGASSSAASNLVINGGSLIYVGDGDSTDRQFTLDTNGGTLTASGSGIVEFASTAPLTLAGANTARTLTLSGTNTGYNLLAAQLDNNGAGVTSLTKTGTGTWRLTNANSTYTGVTRINGGVLSVDQLANGGQASSIGASSNAAANLVIGNGSTLRYTGAGDTTDRQFTLDSGVTFIESSGSGALQFTNTGAVTLTGTNTARTIALGGTNTGNNTFGGTIGNNGTAATTLAKNDSGTWILTGNNTYTGNTVINDGNLVIGNGGTTGNAGAGNVIVDSATSTMSLNRSDIFTFSGTLSGPGTLAQIGAGTSVLTAAGNSIGATTISAGTLQVNGALQTPTVAMTGTSALAVNGTLQASGGIPAALRGDAGNQTVTVRAGGTLLASGDLGGGNDTVNLSGILNAGTGALELGDGDDTLVLNDGAQILGDGVDSSGGSGIDTLVVNTALGYVLDGGDISAFDILTKQNAGVLTLTGAHDFSAGTTIAGGTLAVAGTLQTPSINLADATALVVDGTVDGGAGTAAAITGSIGDNRVTVGATGTLVANGDLGAGNDVLDVAGTLDAGAGVLALGDGNDTLTIHENTRIVGTVSAGAGIDTFDTHIDTVADLGAVQGFETLSKTGAGVLNINGPMSSDFTTVQVAQGILNVTAAGDVAAAPGSALTTIVASGATLNVDGSYGCGAGNDTMTVAGTVSGSGTVDLCGGDDTLTLQDGALVNNAISAGLGTADTLVLDNAGALAFDAGNTTNFELLRKDNTGAATLTGSQSFSGGATITGGRLHVDGTLETPTIDLADGTGLHVDGTVQPGGPAAAAITGSTGINTVSVGAGGTLRASGDLGAGADVLDIAGTLDTGGGVFALGDGDDNFVVHDGTVVIGSIDGGAGLDTRTYAINTSADFGSLLNFEGVTKTGAGVLNITGPGATALQDVQVLEGTLDVHAGASIAATAGSALNAIVASGATLNVDGGFACGSGADRLDISGTVSGSGSVNLCGGDDTLVLSDGANLAGLANPIDGAAGDDRVVLNNAGGLVLNAGRLANFEVLQKDNTGEATLAPGAHSFTGGTVLNGGTLTVAGSLQTPTVTIGDDTVLNVDNQLSAAGGAAAVITGSSGANTVNVRQGGLLVASGDLGEGEDVLNVAGTLDTGAGVLSLGGGADTFTIRDGAAVLGTVDGGAGLDVFNPDINTSADLGALTNFEILTKTGSGVLNVNGPAQSDFASVNVLAGTLNIGPAGGIAGVQAATVAAGATLNLDGSLLFTSGDDILTVAGTVAGGGTLDLGDGNDTFTIQDGADLTGVATPVSGGAGTDVFVADLAGSATLGGAVDFETLTKTNTGTLTVAGPAPSAFTTVNAAGGTLDIGAAGNLGGVVSTTVAGGASLNVDGSFSGSAGNDTMTIAGAVRGTGAIALGNGDDTVTLNDGADLSGFAGMLDGGANSGGGDTVVLDNAAALSFGAGTVSNFEFLAKTNTGTATLVGTQSFSGGTVLDGGTLTVAGTLETPTVGMSDNTVLNVDNVLSAGGGVAAVITGSSGVNTVNVRGGLLVARGDLGDGADLLDIGSTLDTGAGVFALGGGNDRFVVHDGTVVNGTVDGGAGLDTRIYDINLVADLGALVNFEGVTKTGTGVLNINGPATTALQEVRVLGGTLRIAAAGSVAAIAGSPLDTVVAAGATLQVDGRYGCGDGNDTMTVAGTVSGSGTIDMCGGEDVLTLQDGAVLAATVSGGGHGSGDTVVLDNTGAFGFDAARTTQFEILRKENTGVATLTGAQAFTGGTVLKGGTLTIAGQLATPTVTMADDTVLNVGGVLQSTGGAATSVTGSAGTNTVTVGEGGTLRAAVDLDDGDDSFTSRGTVVGALAFGGGNDTASFVGGDITGVAGLDGGDGGNDRLSFNALKVDADALPMQGWERVNLLDGATMSLGRRLGLGGGVLAIDAASRLLANAGASIGGSVENAGTIVTGANRVAIGGSYTGHNGALHVAVSPGGVSSGGLDIAGDVVGTTAVTFISDGSAAAQLPTSIQVITSPNDDPATASSFVPATGAADGTLRLAGSMHPWTFGKEGNNWHLNSAVNVLLPEIAAYAALPSIAYVGIQDSNRLLFQRMAGIRGDTPHCGADETSPQRVYSTLTGECSGFWMAATYSDMKMGADPGFGFSGQNRGLYAGVDQLLEDHANRTWRGGVFVGFQNGDYWTSGANSTGLEVSGKAKVSINAPTFGGYGSMTWKGGTYVDVTATGQMASKAKITTADGFEQSIRGGSLNMNARLGHRFKPGDGWTVEPQLQLGVGWMVGDHLQDASGKQVTIEDAVLRTTRVAVRTEKVFEAAGGARVRPWVTLGLRDTRGEKQSSVHIGSAGSNAAPVGFANHDLGRTATLDIGVEAELNKSVNVFAVGSYDRSVDGSRFEQRQANLGVRIKW